MWKWLHPYAQSERSYQLCQTLEPWFIRSGVLLLLIGTVWGFLFAPMDYQQGDSFRIIYIHVPAAFMAMAAYFAMAVSGLIAMVWQLRQCNMLVGAIAPVGAVFTFLALVSGALWGKPMWGTYWVWDARLTSMLILFFLYLGVIALYNAFEDRKQADKAAALLSLVGVINLPIIHFSVEWWNTLHQGATLSKFEKPSMAPDMLWPLLLNILGLKLFLAGLAVIRLGNELIERESHRPWVQQLAERKNGI